MELRRGEHPFRQYQRPAAASAHSSPRGVGRSAPGGEPAARRAASPARVDAEPVPHADDHPGSCGRSPGQWLSGEVRPEDVLAIVEVDGEGYGVRIFEETGARWSLRLVLQIEGTGGEPARWTDYARRRVEDELSEVLAEFERRAAAVRAASARRFFQRALRTLKVTPAEVVTDASPVYPPYSMTSSYRPGTASNGTPVTRSKPTTATSSTGYARCEGYEPTGPHK
ncbi:hypothetical protein [Plantactinospora sp. KLBMP9567]|uniref:hypothetical protein n=1 Tax=Plantactinospora sp. KLBMP9567 TaxID=3085900 RepID=UPI0029815E0C|nr:hypothetical protein [Plantactinospora sp. KLBMP9567]MDW5330866.1 hypothetical protein [Plantactinospora sp. KLBMP9567]